MKKDIEYIRKMEEYIEKLENQKVMDEINRALQSEDKIIIRELNNDGDLFYINKVNIVNALGFVWDGCHKIYIVEDEDDIQSVRETWHKDEIIFDLGELPRIWSKSCPLRFISNWKLDKDYVSQCSEAMFEFPLWED